ncbi:MAG: lipase family protein [Lachnospiraceae bacterium]|nr:lipase family protein [Lachnospiraceae bacterium]
MTKVLNKMLKKISIVVTSVLIFMMVMPAGMVSAAQNSSGMVITGTYQYTSNEGNNIQQTDTFEYRNSCFEESSFTGCTHLEVLSAQVAIASASWYGESQDAHDTDYSRNAYNITDFLTQMQFEDVSTNKYYTLEKEVNSVGVCVGHKKITANGKDYTLLAIVPRSAGYKEEWAGNFTVNDGSIHYGFKAARDEILRYVKQYINDNNISGDIKVWTCGHSRGSALANLIGGFFAGGGIAYFGGKVSITPQDVYCYTYATPRTIKDGASKNEVLSVEGARAEARYANDTPGAAWNYMGGGTINIKGDEYSGIRNFILDSDIFTKLPPEDWGFEHYGQDIDATHGQVSDEQVAEKLSTISPYSYNLFLNNGGVRNLKLMTFNLGSLSFVEDKSGTTVATGDFLDGRIDGLVSMANSNAEYVSEGWQDALTSLAGIYGLSETYISTDEISLFSLFKPLILSYIVYASEDLIKSGVDENEAAAMVVEDIFCYVTGEKIEHDEFTVDDLIIMLSEFVCENENSQLANQLAAVIAGVVPKDQPFAVAIIKNATDQFNPNPDKEATGIDPVSVKEYIKSWSQGPLPGSEAAENDTLNTADKARGSFYMLLLAAGSLIPEKMPDLKNVIDISSQPYTAPAPVSELVKALRPMILTERDEEGEIIEDKSYDTFAEAADGNLCSTLDEIFAPIIEKCRAQYGEAYAAKLQAYVNGAKDNVTKLRQLVIELVFHSDGERSFENDIKILSTFASNVNRIRLSHFNELYTAYAKAYAQLAGEDPNHGRPVEADGNRVEAAASEIDEILAAFDNDPALEEETQTVVLNMVGTTGIVATVAPVELLEKIQGRNIDLVLDMGEYAWTINGKDITDISAINLEVKFEDNIPAESVSKLAGSKPTKQISLTHDGDFGFTASLTLNMGAEYAGKYGTLYWYTDGNLKFMNGADIDDNGKVTLTFTHASDYVVVVNEAKTPQTGDTSHVMSYMLLGIMAFAAVDIIIVMRKKKHM